MDLTRPSCSSEACIAGYRGVNCRDRASPRVPALVRRYRSRPSLTCKASADPSGGQEDGLKKMMRKVQGALPVIGLISRLTTPEGGIGSDELAYPEYCRKVFEAAPEGFQIAVAELQNKYGKSAQRRFVLLCLWMVKEGCGLCSEKLIVDCARRVRVSQDIEFEMERFLGEYNEGISKYSYMNRPRGTPQQQADLAVDALARLCLPIQDGEPIPEEDVQFIEDAVYGGLMMNLPEFRQNIRTSISTREQRAKTYV